MKRLSTTGRATSEAIRDREDFETSGALRARNVLGFRDAGRLAAEDLEQFMRDSEHIDYVVLSYGTPIAWHVASGEENLLTPKQTHWHIVTQKFSVTTSRHQGNLYLINEDG